MTKYLFSIAYYRESKPRASRAEKGVRVDVIAKKFEEFIVAETMEQAIEHWRMEFLDQGVTVEEIKRHVPVLSVLP